MFKRNLSKAIISLLNRIGKGSKTAAKRMIRTLMRSLMVMTRRNKLPMAGFMLAFVLPTVTMVMLVVVLLTLAITLRSFDRAQNARNVKVNQQVLAAATPALERAKAKIEYLLNEDPNRPTGTPSDISIKGRLSNLTGTATDTYTFNDEIRLRIGYKLNRDSLSAASWDKDNQELVENKEAINTVWRFPVDTDNNGKYDSYTIYGVYFRSPPRDGADGATAGQFLVERKPLETRTPPMPGTLGNQQCKDALGTSASLVGDSGWYQSDGKLKKSFYVYTVTVPITKQPTSANNQIPVGQFETFKGTKGFSALEYQQDRVRVPLLNNAVVYEDDLEISPGPAFRINGGMLTNSNLLVTSTNSKTVDIFLISGQNSCYYKQENSKILVGGNVVNGSASGISSGISTIHLFQKLPTLPITAGEAILTTGNQSVSDAVIDVLYNNNAYAKRIDALVDEQFAKADTTDPKSVQKSVAGGKDRKKALQTYFETLTRKVPFKEVPLLTPENITGTVTEGTGDTLRPKRDWALPTNVNADATVAEASGPTGLTLNVNNLKAQNPNPNGGTKPSKEDFLGDRILAGNNLPLKWWDGSKFVGGTTTQQVAGGKWTDDTQRTRTTQKQTLAAVGVSDRGDYWEKAAAQKPENPLSAIGGLRVITGAGVYERKNSFLPPPRLKADGTVDTYDDPATTTVAEKYEVVWPDSMPMSPVRDSTGAIISKVFDNSKPVSDPNSWFTPTATVTAATPTIDPSTPKYAKGDLRMRATAVYHYAKNSYNQPDFNSDVYLDKTQKPIACVSSYYDPTNNVTARNRPDTPSGVPAPANGAMSTPGADVSGWAGPTYLPPTSPGTRTAGDSYTNNGIVYGPPTTNRPTAAGTLADGKLTGSPQELYDQANMVFPDGRFVNEQLRAALMKAEADRNLAEQAAIDSTMCAFGILGTSGFTLGTPLATIPNGAIKEVALLNSREVKAIDKDDTSTAVDETFTLSSPTGAGAAKLTGNYDLALEERMPLEIRVTQIDLNVLRNQSITLSNDPEVASETKGPSPEYLLPNSGIIYASRDDAARDRSDPSEIISPTDSRLDPTRRPHGIMLINGRFLARNDANNDGQNDTAPTSISDVVQEKGLTLVSNLPVYVQDDFNVHSQQEFNTALDQSAWGNFYGRAGNPLNKNFACRPGDPRLPDCTIGDTWRAATVLADAVTVLSRNFRPGFRNEGDFDLRNNAGQAITGYDFTVPADGIKSGQTVSEATYNIDLNGDGDTADTAVPETQVTAKAARLLNGFYNNNFVTNGLSSGATFNINGDGSTPNIPNSPVTPTDSVTTGPNYSATGGTAPNSSYFNNFVTPVQRRGAYPEYAMEMCLKLPVSACGPNDWWVNAAGTMKATSATALTQLESGTTARPATNEALRRYPRRVAFRRNVTTNELVLTAGKPVPIGVDSGTTVKEYSTGVPTSQANSLRFKTTTSTTVPSTVATYTATDGLFYQNAPTGTMQPQLAPVLQIHVTKTGDPTGADAGRTDLNNTRWLSRARDTTFNLVVAAGDTPSRTNGDSNGGMQNLTRFLEHWNPENTNANTNILGSFIQLNRSAYATAPWTAILDKNTANSLFGYPSVYKIQNTAGQVPSFVAPNRLWGYDVGLLSQSPDLFTQLFTTPTTQTNSDEFFREVSRDDIWVKTLLCAKTHDDPTVNAVDDDQRPKSFCDDTTKIPNPLPTP